MMWVLRSRSEIAVLAASCFIAGPAASHSSYPTKSNRIIVPYPAGSSNDILGRYFGAKLTEQVGEQNVIDNRGGAIGIIGTEMAANARRNCRKYPVSRKQSRAMTRSGGLGYSRRVERRRRQSHAYIGTRPCCSSRQKLKPHMIELEPA